MEDFVGVRVADAGETGRIGEGTLECVVLPPEHESEAGEVGFQHLEPAPAERRKGSFTLDHVKRGPPLRSCLRQQQRPDREVKCGEAHSPRHGDPHPAPVQPTGNHEVEHQEKLPLEAHHDPLAEPPHLHHPSSLGFNQARRHRTQEERARQSDTGQLPAADERRQALDVDDDIGELRHLPRIITLRRRQTR
jgi:hypothetical protein